MKHVNGRFLEIVLSYTSFILSGSLIFSPLHKSSNIVISLISAMLSGFIALFVILHFKSRLKQRYKKSVGFLKFLSIIISAGAIFASLMMLTEVIKDVAYIANRGISLYYYSSIAIIILIVSLYLCCSSSKGIFRFSIICFIPFFTLCLIIFSSFFTTKSLIFDVNLINTADSMSAIKTGIKTGVFFIIDSVFYIYCFDKMLISDSKKSLYTGFLVSFILICIYNTVTVMIFGTNLTKTISDPDYALIKLLPGIDMTEIISALRIISFLIKSSIYIHCCSFEINKTFFPQRNKYNLIIGLHYGLIPLTFLSLALFDKTLKYGAFQQLIYLVVIITSALFLLASFFQKKI